MNQVCFPSSLTPSEWAAWAQAVGSIAAVVAAALIGYLQLRHATRASEATHRAQVKAIANATYLICSDVLALLEDIEKYPDDQGLNVDAARADRAFAQLTALISPSAPPDSLWQLIQVQAEVSKLQTLLAKCVGRAKNKNTGLLDTIHSIGAKLQQLQLAAAKEAK
jgi:hypothetical protein